MIKSIKDIINKPLFQVDPNGVFPISITMSLVNVEVGVIKEPGKRGEFPITICTAIVSPMALAIARMIAVKIPGEAAGTSTLRMVCQRVAPKAREASL